MMRPCAGLLVASLITAGCQHLDHLPPGTCDNGALESGEDCDLYADPALGDGTRCEGCRYRCTAGAVCPAGWGCGAGDVCVHATGTFREAAGSPYDLAADDLAVADIDGDGRVDVVGFAPGGVVTLLGDGAGRMEAGPSYLLADERTGPPAVADVDADGRADIVVPFAPGLVVLRGDRNRTLAPMIYAPFEAAGTDALWWVPLSVRGIAPEDAILNLRNGGGAFLAAILPIPTANVQIEWIEPAGPSLADLGARLPVADADTGNDGDEFALAFAGAAEVTVHGSAHFLDGRLFIRELARVAVPVVDRGALLTDVDGDGAIDLLVSAGADRVLVAEGDGSGSFTAAVEVPAFDQLAADVGAPAPAQRRWPLAAADLDADGDADYVGCDGIYLAGGGGIAVAAPRTSAAPWTDAAVADFNGDGRTDVVAVSSDRAALEFLLADGGGGFSRFLLETAAPPWSMRAGDFDGDFVADLAFVEPGAAGETDTISVSFGAASGGPGAPVTMGQVPDIERLELGHLQGRRFPFDGRADLVIVAGPGPTGARALGFLGGTSRRTMLSAFSLHRSGIGDDVPLGVQAGRFTPAPAGGPLDLMALAEDQGVRAFWSIPAQPEARLSLVASTRQSASQVLGSAPFDPACGLFATGDVDGDGVDEIVGVDQRDGCTGTPLRLPSLAVFAADGAGLAAAVVSLALPAGLPERIALADVDGDGDRDLLVVGGGAVVVLWNRDGVFDAVAPASIAGSSAVVLNADADPAPELAVVAEGVIAIVEVVGEALVGTSTAVPAAGPVVAADVDGDGLDDLLALAAGRLSVHLARSHHAEGP